MWGFGVNCGLTSRNSRLSKNCIYHPASHSLDLFWCLVFKYSTPSRSGYNSLNETRSASLHGSKSITAKLQILCIIIKDSIYRFESCSHPDCTAWHGMSTPTPPSSLLLVCDLYITIRIYSSFRPIKYGMVDRRT